MFGSDSTGGGIGFQFRQIKANAKVQKACFTSGGDPLTLGIGSMGGSVSTKGSSTSTSLSFITVHHITFPLLLSFFPCTAQHIQASI
jgi:hypothetical protein